MQTWPDQAWPGLTCPARPGPVGPMDAGYGYNVMLRVFRDLKLRFGGFFVAGDTVNISELNNTLFCLISALVWTSLAWYFLAVLGVPRSTLALLDTACETKRNKSNLYMPDLFRSEYTRPNQARTRQSRPRTAKKGKCFDLPLFICLLFVVYLFIPSWRSDTGRYS